MADRGTATVFSRIGADTGARDDIPRIYFRGVRSNDVAHHAKEFRRRRTGCCEECVASGSSAKFDDTAPARCDRFVR